MTLAQACDQLRDLVRYEQDEVTFARIYAAQAFSTGKELTPSVLEHKLSSNGIIRFVRQEYGSRTYLVDYKRLNAVESEDGA